MRSSKLLSAIRKPDRSAAGVKGRRVSIPQEVFGFDDDDGIHFQGTILLAAERRCLVLFDYTGEEEWFPLVMIRKWLLSEVPVEPLCALL